MEGRFEEARALIAAADAAFEELGRTLGSAVSHHAAMVELLAGDPVAAERLLRQGYAALEEMGEKRCSPRRRRSWARRCWHRGVTRKRGSGRSSAPSRRTRTTCTPRACGARCTRRCLSARGESADAERYAREALAFAERTDDTNTIADAHVVLGGVLALRRDTEAARAELSRAVELYERKGNLVAGRSGARPACSARARLRRSAPLAMATSKFFEELPLLMDGTDQVGLCVMGPIGTGDNIVWVRAWAWQQNGDNSRPRRATRESTCPERIP